MCDSNDEETGSSIHSRSIAMLYLLPDEVLNVINSTQ